MSIAILLAAIVAVLGLGPVSANTVFGGPASPQSASSDNTGLGGPSVAPPPTPNTGLGGPG